MLKHIILDFGGVLYDVDYFKATQEFSKLSTTPEMLDSMSFEEIFHLPEKFEKGEMSESEFRNMLRRNFNINAMDSAIDKAWNSMLLGLKGDALTFVSALKEKYSVYLLSNTNSIHYADFIMETSAFMTYFDKQYLSYKMGMRKPDDEIFSFVRGDIGFDFEECIFIDDSLINIEAAKSAGWNSLHYSTNMTLSDLLHSISHISTQH